MGSASADTTVCLDRQRVSTLPLRQPRSDPCAPELASLPCQGPRSWVAANRTHATRGWLPATNSLATKSKGHAEPNSLGPDHAALLPDRSIKQLKASGQSHLSANFDTGAAGRIIDDAATDGRYFWTKNDGGRTGHPSRWTNPFVESRLCHLTPPRGQTRIRTAPIVTPSKTYNQGWRRAIVPANR